ncbi:MAG: ATP-binding protein [Rhodocyclaceae bacterium]|nr:ATP-binding protein [Rhodocyclaceae bacterium]
MKLAPLTPIPTPTLPLKGRATTDAPCSSPFKGEAGRGMGNVFHVKIIHRHLSHEFLTQLDEYPIVTVLGPRQSGKTTLVRTLLPDYRYVNLEDPDIRHFAIHDPKAFLLEYDTKVIFDEVQRVPELLSYLQVKVDVNRNNGQFVLTGSHQLSLRAAVSQSLAGRTGILYLLPFSIDELTAATIKFDNYETYLFQGFLPRIYDQKQRPHIAYANYYQTYVERDVRQLTNIKDTAIFEKFMRLLAGRTGQIMNYQSLAGDVGVDGKTIKHWLSILEASFIVFPLQPYFNNFGKRVIKSPKYYFMDTGLLCYLLGIEKKEQVLRDPLLGSLFENLIILEVLKSRYHAGRTPNLYFYRDNHGHEIDLLYVAGNELTGIEIKSASTWHDSFAKNLLHFSKSNTDLKRSIVVYSGNARTFSSGLLACPFDAVKPLIFG